MELIIKLDDKNYNLNFDKNIIFLGKIICIKISLLMNLQVV